MSQTLKNIISEKKLTVKEKKDTEETLVEKFPQGFLKKDTIAEFKKRKLMTSALIPRYTDIGQYYNDDRFLNWAYRVENCGSYLEFYNWQITGYKVKTANFCKDRLCPTCNWRRSLRMFAKLSKIIQSETYQKSGYKNLFLTLTVQNCSIDELHIAIKNIFYSFDKFLKNKAIRVVVKGYFRALEITYNPVSQTFHPHLHVILAVPKNYFSTYYYLSQAKFTYYWQKSLGADYTPIVDIRKFSDGKGIAEASKYVIKSDNKFLKSISDEALRILRLELQNVRLIGNGGIFRAIAKELKLTMQDDIVENEIPTDDILLEILTLRWNIGFKNYEIFKREVVGF